MAKAKRSADIDGDISQFPADVRAVLQKVREATVIDGQVVGAVGVGGETGEQDVEVAKAGIPALLDALGQKK